MKENSLEPIFITVTSDISSLVSLCRGEYNDGELRHAVARLPFNAAYDFFRSAARSLADEGRADEAIEKILGFDSLTTRMGEEDGPLLDMHAALMQILTALYIQAGRLDEALSTAAVVLNLLAQEPKRKDEPFLSIMASLLYDIALIHNERGEYKQAEREIEKSMKIFERLAKTSPDRYGPAHILAMKASTGVYRSRMKQVNVLAHYQVAANTYLQMMNEGIEDAGNRLVDTLAEEGLTLMKMGRHREAIQYFTRALKYLTKLEPVFNRRQLNLSIRLGEALVNVKNTRDKGIHLLNTMLHKAVKINADEEHRQIVDILVNVKTRNLDILGIWHKIFPR